MFVQFLLNTNNNFFFKIYITISFWFFSQPVAKNSKHLKNLYIYNHAVGNFFIVSEWHRLLYRLLEQPWRKGKESYCFHTCANYTKSILAKEFDVYLMSQKIQKYCFWPKVFRTILVLKQLQKNPATIDFAAGRVRNITTPFFMYNASIMFPSVEFQ